MNIKSVSKQDMIWGYLAQFLNVGSGVIVIPLAIKCLSTEDMAFWYLFLAIAGLAQLLEFGFQPTISRLTSYVYSGAVELKSEGLPETNESLDNQLLFDLILASRKIYKYIAVATLIVLGVFGTLYLNTFDEFQRSQIYAWLIFSISTVINFFFTYYNGLIVGRGQQQELYRVMAISKIFMLLITMPLLLMNFGLLSMALGALSSMAYTRFMLYRCFYDPTRKETSELKLLNKKDCLIRTVWLSAWKLGLTSLGSFLILRANLFISSSYLGLKVTASYGLTIQVISILSNVSAMIFLLNLPKLNSLQSRNNNIEIKNIFSKSLLYAHGLYFLGSVGLIFVGLPLLGLISANTTLVSIPLLCLILLMHQLELNHSICAQYLTTLNIVPFVYAAIISGFLIVFGSLMTVTFTTLGLVGLVLSQFIVQLCYNNWYWPLVTYRNIYNVTKI